MSDAYQRFLARKSQLGGEYGFEPAWLPDCLFGFQRHLVEWAVRRGRAAVFAECGLGKTLMELVFAENVVRRTNKPVLIVTPLGVAAQTLREAERFGVDAVRSRDGKFPAGARVVVTNYERLRHFDPADFAGGVPDESGCLKDFTSKRRVGVTDFLRKLPYRLLCTATPSPNDFVELGTSSEALGELGYQDMLSRFFKNEQNTSQGQRLYCKESKWQFRGHAEEPFWRWVCSWARACRRPSDLGFDDGDFLLPELTVRERTVASKSRRPGELFERPAASLEEVREERRRTLRERCCKAAELANSCPGPFVAWCNLNDEGDLLEELIPGSVQVSGSDPDDAKEEAFAAFASGQIRVLVTKPKIGGWGMNWQHCSRLSYFPDYSFESWYQLVRRFWRFGQTSPVTVDVVAGQGEAGVLAALERKGEQAERMFANLVRLMKAPLRVNRGTEYPRGEVVPDWLAC